MSPKVHSTQDHLPIAGIQDGVVIMTDGSIRVVLKVEPTNFELKSSSEQDGIIYSYQAFLNSLDFPIQILVQSKRLDLEQYLVRMEEQQHTVTNELLQIQMEDYIGFVRRLISVANIMSKRFYVIVSFSATNTQGSLNQLAAIIPHQPTGPLFDQDEFDRLRNECFNRANIIAGGLARLGSKAFQLDTQQLIELFYGIYNPDVATEERLTDISNLSTGVVTAPELALSTQPEALSAELSAPSPEENLHNQPPS